MSEKLMTWAVTEGLGVSAYNPRAVDRLMGTRPTEILRLQADHHAVFSADYYSGGLTGEAEIRLLVTYTDPPGAYATKPLKLLIGTYEGGVVDSRNERKDVLDEVERSYPQEWAAFLADLPNAIKVAEVMLS